MADAYLADRFAAAAAHVAKATQGVLTRADMLQLYGCYKQATAGAAPSKSDGATFDLKAQAKHKAWKACSALSKDEAMARYCELVANLIGPGNVAPRATPQAAALVATSAEQSSPIRAAASTLTAPPASAEVVVLSTEEANLCVALADQLMRALDECVHVALGGGAERSSGLRPDRPLDEAAQQQTRTADVSDQKALPMPSAIEPQTGHVMPDNLDAAPTPRRAQPEANCLRCLACMRAGDEERETS